MRALLRWTVRLVVVAFVLGVAGALAVCYAPGLVRDALKVLGGYGKVAAALIPPAVPDIPPPQKAVWLDQNWKADQRIWMHNVSQGTATIPVPYAWFKALERPELSLVDFLVPRGSISDPAYLARLGFISPEKAGDLPVGFAVLDAMTDPATGKAEPQRLGLTCAACHTGQVRYGGTALLIDGGPAMIDLGSLESVIGLSICYTDIIPWRRWRFISAVLKAEGEPAGEARDKAETDLRTTLHDACEIDVKAKVAVEREILSRRKVDDTPEGFGRLDALNRIGNRVFYDDLIGSKPTSLTQAQLEANFAALNAPVSFPPIWDVPHFVWAQYDASILGPEVRNIGEALGVSASLNMTDPARPYFASTVRKSDIDQIEGLLSGSKPAFENKAFSGLTAPEWSKAAANFPDDENWKIKSDLVDKGRDLYKTNCFECHRGPVRDEIFDRKWPEDSFWAETNPDQKGRGLDAAGWISIGGEMVYKEMEKPVAHMGTDPEQSRVLSERQVRLPAELGVGPVQDLNAAARKLGKPEGCGLPDDPALTDNYALNLMAVVARVQAQLPLEISQHSRPNCPNPGVFRTMTEGGDPPKQRIVAEPRYRARPLDGVWATAPYLHNGSVPTLEELLTPQAERPTWFCVGSANFDPKAVGLAHKADEVPPSPDSRPGTPGTCSKPGLTLFEASERGNSNLGHSFEDVPDGKPKAGVLGPRLSDSDRTALIEYLKTL